MFRWFKISALAMAFFIIAPADSALSACDIPMSQNDIALVPQTPLVGRLAKIYVTVQSACSEDVEGVVSFTAGGEGLGSKPFSYKASGKQEEVWIGWTPVREGRQTVDVVVAGGALSSTVSLEVFVDHDPDEDGIGNRTDTDDDNDGVADAEDQFPLDPTRNKDTDKDGTDDAVDTDDDNDGVYDFKEKEMKTDPLKRDTDGDGVDDKRDVYPLDPKQSAEPEQGTENDEPLAIGAASLEKTMATGTATMSESERGGTYVLRGDERRYGAGNAAPVFAATTSIAQDDDGARGNYWWVSAALTATASVFFFWKSRKA